MESDIAKPCLGVVLCFPRMRGPKGIYSLEESLFPLDFSREINLIMEILKLYKSLNSMENIFVCE